MDPKKQLEFATRILIGLLLSSAALLVNDRFFFESVLVPSESMEPTLLANERGFVKRFGIGEIRRFDIVVFARESGKRMVKRVVGLPGECIELRDSWKAVIDGKELEYSESSPAPGNPAIEAQTGRAHRIFRQGKPGPLYETLYAKTPLCLGPDEFYVLGDNRLASGDSRHFGPIKRADIQGRLTWLWYSYDLKRGALRRDRMGLAID